MKLRLTDNITGQAIAYANIGIIEKNIGTVSDADGYFSLSAHPDDLVTIYSIGYEQISLPAKDLLDRTNCKLNPTDYQLSTVEIQASRFYKEAKTLGPKNKKRGDSIGFESA